MTALDPTLKISRLFLIVNFTEHAGCDGHGPCIHGTCELAQNGTYVCNCDEGWYGIECDVPGMCSVLDVSIALVLCMCEASKTPSTEECCWRDIFVHLTHMILFCMQWESMGMTALTPHLRANRNPYA